MAELNHYLILSAVLFAIGTAGVFLRRNLITVLLSIEVMLNAVNVTFVAFGHFLSSADGQIIGLFVIAVAAAEAGVGLAIVVALLRRAGTIGSASGAGVRQVQTGSMRRYAVSVLIGAVLIVGYLCLLHTSPSGR